MFLIRRTISRNCTKLTINNFINQRLYSNKNDNKSNFNDKNKPENNKKSTAITLTSDPELKQYEKKNDVDYHLAIKNLDTYEDDSQVVYDITDENLNKDEDESKFKYLFQNRQSKKLIFKDPKLIKRGKDGVFDLDQMVYALTKEKIKDIAVIKIPENVHINKFFVIGSARSTKHLESVYDYIIKLYKLKKSPDDKFPHYEGQKSHTWKIMDMDIIMLHLFLDEKREFYDIEQLWCVGSEYDDKCRIKKDKLEEMVEEHAKILEHKENVKREELKNEFKQKLIEHQQHKQTQI